MTREEIQIFVDAAAHYFLTVSRSSAEVSTPYLIEHLSPALYEYSGIIGVSGNYQGNVIFSAAPDLLSQLLDYYPSNSSNSSYQDSDLHLDLVGEIANTIAGNARQHLGDEFGISPPVLSRGNLQEVKTAEGLQTYCIPLVWQQLRANVIVAMV